MERLAGRDFAVCVAASTVNSQQSTSEEEEEVAGILAIILVVVVVLVTILVGHHEHCACLLGGHWRGTWKGRSEFAPTHLSLKLSNSFLWDPSDRSIHWPCPRTGRGWLIWRPATSRIP